MVNFMTTDDEAYRERIATARDERRRVFEEENNRVGRQRTRTSEPEARLPRQPQVYKLGVALPFDTVSTCNIPHWGRIRLRRGCFDGFLDRLHRGQETVRLLISHDDSQQLAASGSSFQVLADDRQLTLAIMCPLLAAAMDRLYSQFPCLSCGDAPVAWHYASDSLGRLIEVTESRLLEISLVPSGAYAGTTSDAAKSITNEVRQHAMADLQRSRF